MGWDDILHSLSVCLSIHMVNLCGNVNLGKGNYMKIVILSF